MTNRQVSAFRKARVGEPLRFSSLLLASSVVVLLSALTLSAQVTARISADSNKATVTAVQGQGSEGAKSSGSFGASGQVTLPELVGEALRRNPAIKSAAMRVEVMRAAVPQARALPDPMLSGSWMGGITPITVQPGSYRQVSISEHLPFPGKLKLRGEIADRQAEAAWWKYEDTRRQVVSEVKAAYYQYFYDYKATAITKKDKDLLVKLENIAEVRYKVGKGIQEDVLRAQVEVSRLDQQLIILNQEEKTAQVRLNTLLYRDPETPLAPPASFAESKFPYSLDDLFQLARNNEPHLQQDRRLIEASQDAVRLAEKAYDPDFTVAYIYQQRPQTMPTIHDSQGFTVGINIPIFYRSKQREGVIEAANNLTAARQDLDNERTTVNFEVKQEYLAAKAAQNLARLYSKAIVPQSSLALESAMASYEVGKVDFLSMLDNFLNVLNYEVGYYQQLSDFEISLARLEPLVGVELAK